MPDPAGSKARLAHLEAMNQLSRILEQDLDMEAVLRKALSGCLDILECDRSWLAYPADPDATSLRYRFQANRQGIPAIPEERERPMGPDMRGELAAVMASPEPVSRGDGAEARDAPAFRRGLRDIPTLSVCIRPKLGKPWIFAVQDRNPNRAWSRWDRKLFGAVGASLASAIGNQTVHRNLRASEERFRWFVDNTTELIWRFDLKLPMPTGLTRENQIAWFYREAVLAEANQSMAVYSGFQRPEEILGRFLRDFLSPRVHANTEFLGRFIQSGYRLLDAESEERDPGGGLRYSLNNLVGIREGDLLTGVWGSTRDITDLKIAQDRLRQSEKMEAVGRLAGGIAHDFNNLLTAINGYAQLATSHPDLPDGIKEFMQEISKAGERAAGLTSQLLAYSRKAVLQPKMVNLNAAMADMQNMLRRIIGEDILFEHHPGPDLGLVKVDPSQLGQVILNLAVNARDAMPRGGKLVMETGNVTLPGPQEEDLAEAPPGRYVFLSVEDTGIGMSPETQKRIFEPFYTTKGVKGTGLGLSSVYGIVKQSGGYITVRSGAGSGACFRIYLPRAESPAPSAPDGAAHEEAPRGTEAILLAEDEDPVRKFMRATLEALGYAVAEARDGDEACRLLETERYPASLLITDIVMPGLAGRKLAARAARVRPDLKVLYISGYNEQFLTREDPNVPAAQFLRKPFSPVQLARKVRGILDHSTAQHGN